MRYGSRRHRSSTELVRIISKTHDLRRAIAAWESMITQTEYIEPEIWLSPTEYEAELTLRMVIQHQKVLMKAWKDGSLWQFGIDAKVGYDEAKKIDGDET